jgi:hypothetical protein
MKGIIGDRTFANVALKLRVPKVMELVVYKLRS